VFNNFFFENRAVCEKIWKNTVERGRPQMTKWRMRIACWIPKATHKHTHTKYVTFFILHCNSGCNDAPQCYVYCLSCTWSVLVQELCYRIVQINQKSRNSNHTF